MIGPRLPHSQNRPVLPALLALVLLPATLFAETIYVRNEGQVAVVVQVGSVVRGVLRRDPPCVLKPGEVAPGTLLPGNKIITIHDARAPNRILFQGTIPAAKEDGYFGVVPDVKMPRMRIETRKAFPLQ